MFPFWLSRRGDVPVSPLLGLNSTLIAGAQKAAGGDNVYYIGDTKEKGLEFIGYVAKFARVIAAQQAQDVSAIEEFLFEDQTNRVIPG